MNRFQRFHTTMIRSNREAIVEHEKRRKKTFPTPLCAQYRGQYKLNATANPYSFMQIKLSNCYNSNIQRMRAMHSNHEAVGQ